MNETESNLNSSSPKHKSKREIRVTLSVEEQELNNLFGHIPSLVVSALTAAIEPKLRNVLKAPLPQDIDAAQPRRDEGVRLSEADRLTALDLRTALLLGKVPETAGLLIDVKTTAKLLNISGRHLYRLADEKAIPEPVRLGRLIRWRLGELLAWIDAGCPPQRQWTYQAETESRSRRR